MAAEQAVDHEPGFRCVAQLYRQPCAQAHLQPQFDLPSGSPCRTGRGYYIADMLPPVYYSTKYVDSSSSTMRPASRPRGCAAGATCTAMPKVGASWRANGNVRGRGVLCDPSLAPNGYRPPSVYGHPYMHNLAAYVEETLTVPLGSATLQLMAGLRAEKTFIKNTQYENTSASRRAST